MPINIPNNFCYTIDMAVKDESSIPNLLLDDLGIRDVEFAVSTRRISKTYTGPCMVVTDSSANDFTIGFDDNGDLDVEKIKTSIPTGEGLIRVWYNQAPSGSQRDLIQSNVNSAPRIINNGVIETIGSTGKPMAFTPVVSNDSLSMDNQVEMPNKGSGLDNPYFAVHMAGSYGLPTGDWTDSRAELYGANSINFLSITGSANASPSQVFWRRSRIFNGNQNSSGSTASAISDGDGMVCQLYVNSSDLVTTDFNGTNVALSNANWTSQNDVVFYVDGIMKQYSSSTEGYQGEVIITKQSSAITALKVALVKDSMNNYYGLF